MKCTLIKSHPSKETVLRSRECGHGWATKKQPKYQDESEKWPKAAIDTLRRPRNQLQHDTKRKIPTEITGGGDCLA